MANNEISKSFIVDEADYSKGWAEKVAARALKFAKVTKTGGILIQTDNLSVENKIKLAFVTRFIAHSFDENISHIMTPSDLGGVITNESANSLTSRVSRLADSGFIKKQGYGKYVVQPYKIEAFLSGLENPSEGVRVPRTSRNKKQSVSSTGENTGRGAGRDIAELISANFFEQPRTVIEVKSKLEEEVKYHDVRVIDAMIRNTFVASKKVLKRIPNEGDGKAKWKYVIRN